MSAVAVRPRVRERAVPVVAVGPPAAPPVGERARRSGGMPWWRSLAAWAAIAPAGAQAYYLLTSAPASSGTQRKATSAGWRSQPPGGLPIGRAGQQGRDGTRGRSGGRRDDHAEPAPGDPGHARAARRPA